MCAMTAGARTLSLEETLLNPPALPPPPTRHALLVIVIPLAPLLHVVTIGTGDLYSETEGQYAGAAREMVARYDWLLPTNNGMPRLQKPPLLYWLIIASYKILGVNEAAARLPVALAVVATVALIFLIGEKLSDYWRGFVAGLMFISFCGTFLLARIVMPETLVTAFMAGAMFCGICGYERRRHRRRRLWFSGVWIFAALACLTKGLLGMVYPAVVFVLLSIFYREARIRFRALLRWEYVLIFLLILAPWHIWAQWHFPHYFRYVRSEWLGHLLGLTDETHDFLGAPAYQFVILHLASWFPWSMALLPGTILAWLPVLPPCEIGFADRLLGCSMGVLFLPVLVITAVSFVFFSIVALYFIFKQRGKLAAIALAASMIPAGLSMVVGVAKTAPYFSLADVARYLNPRLETGGHAMFEGPLDDSSSLIFYLNRRFSFVNQNPRKEAPMGAPATDIFLNEQAVLDKWGQPDAVYLIVEQSRADYWK